MDFSGTVSEESSKVVTDVGATAGCLEALEYGFVHYVIKYPLDIQGESSAGVVDLFFQL